jgi:hypothetical protein
MFRFLARPRSGRGRWAFARLLCFAVPFFAATLAAPAVAKSIVDQPGQFRVWLPGDFRILRHGRDRDRAVAGQLAYEFKAVSAKGNIKVFAQSSYKADPSIDFMKQFAYMEYEVRREKLYKWLRPVGGPQRGSAGRITQFWRYYDAVGQRDKTVQPYRLLAFVAFDRPIRRLYTVTIAAQTDVFDQNRTRLMTILRSFRPYVAPPHKVGKKRPLRRISLRGKLRVRRNGLVVAKKIVKRAVAQSGRRGVARPLARAVARPAAGKGRAAVVRKPAPKAKGAAKPAAAQSKQRAAARKPEPKKPAAKKPAPKKAPSKKAPSKKAPSKKPAAKKEPAPLKDAKKPAKKGKS